MVSALINTAFAQETRKQRTNNGTSSRISCAELFQGSQPRSTTLNMTCWHSWTFPKRTGLDATTNALERLNAEVKRRADVVRIFLNDASIVRLVGALTLKQSDEWQLQRRYMQLEGLNSVSDNQAARLSAVITD